MLQSFRHTLTFQVELNWFTTQYQMELFNEPRLCFWGYLFGLKNVLADRLNNRDSFKDGNPSGTCLDVIKWSVQKTTQTKTIASMEKQTSNMRFLLTSNVAWHFFAYLHLLVGELKVWWGATCVICVLNVTRPWPVKSAAVPKQRCWCQSQYVSHRITGQSSQIIHSAS